MARKILGILLLWVFVLNLAPASVWMQRGCQMPCCAPVAGSHACCGKTSELTSRTECPCTVDAAIPMLVSPAVGFVPIPNEMTLPATVLVEAPAHLQREFLVSFPDWRGPPVTLVSTDIRGRAPPEKLV